MKKPIIFLKIKNFFTSKRTLYALRTALKKLAQLNHLFFESYLQIDYLKNKNVVDKKLDHLYLQWIQSMLSVKKINIKCNVKLKKIENLAKIMFALHQLRLRIKDFAIFEIVAREIFMLQNTSTLLLLKLQKNISISKEIEDFLQAVHNFEAMYERTLRVTAKDPLVFLIFIQDLYELYDGIQLMGSQNAIHEK